VAMRAEDVDDFDFELPLASSNARSEPPRIPPSIPSLSQMTGSSFGKSPLGTAPDRSIYKDWTTIYPIYFDAKRPRKSGERKVSNDKAVMYPKAAVIAMALNRLGFKSTQLVLEHDKTHPRDWSNPGRVKVQLKNPENGKPVNSRIPDKKAAIDRVATILFNSQPENLVPVPWKRTLPTPKDVTEVDVKGKGVDQNQEKFFMPPIAERLPLHSPAVSHGLHDMSMHGNLPAMMGMPDMGMGMGMPGMGGVPGGGSAPQVETGKGKKKKK